MRALIAFLAIFAVIAVPNVALLVVALTAPPAYVLKAPVPDGWLVGMDAPGFGHVDVKRFETPADARRWSKSRLKQMNPSYFESRFDGVARFEYEEGRKAGMLLPVENYAIQISTDQASKIDQMVAAIPFLERNRDEGLSGILFDNIGYLVAGILAYAVLAMFVVLRIGSWAATIGPRGNNRAVERLEMERRILELNDLDVPFTVTWRGRRLVAEWRLADAKWSHLLQANTLSRTEYLVLDLNERSRTVRVVEKSTRLSTAKGLFGVLAAFSFWQGISLFRLDLERAAGTTFHPVTGWSIQEAYSYRFNSSEMKKPVADVVTQSGWTWKPVVTLIRPLGG